MAVPDREAWRQMVPDGEKEVPDPMIVVLKGKEWSRLSVIIQGGNSTPFLRSLEFNERDDMVVIETGTKDWSKNNKETGYRLRMAFLRSDAKLSSQYMDNFMEEASGEVYFVGTEKDLVLVLPIRSLYYDPLRIVVPYSAVHFRLAHLSEPKPVPVS